MLFQKESLYGWGVCNIPMPRATLDIYSDRRRRNINIFPYERRNSSSQQNILADISGFMRQDVEWPQTILTVTFSLLALIFIYLMNFFIPVISEPEMPEPVEIVIKIEKEMDPIPLDYVEPVLSEPVPKKEEPRPVQKKDKVVKAAPSVLYSEQLEEELPDIRIQPRIVERPRKALIKPDTLNVRFKEKEIAKEVEIKDPVINNQRYKAQQHDPDLNIVPQKTTLIKGLRVETPDEITPLKPSMTLPKSRVKVATRAVPLSKTALQLKNPVQATEVSPLKKSSKKDYTQNKIAQPSALPSGRIDSFITKAESPVAAITPAIRTQKTYHRSVDPKRKITPVPSQKTKLFSSASVEASPLRAPKKIFSNIPDNPSTPHRMPESTSPAPDMASKSAEVTLNQTVVLTKQYASQKNTSGYLSPDLPEATGVAQIPTEKTEMAISDISDSSRINGTQNVLRNHVDGNGVPGTSQLSLDIKSVDDIDPAELISLRQLAVCADPEEEFNLKTKLATLLGGPAKCGSQGVLYFFKYTESGYTIQVSIYNPEGVVLNDRCSVLQSAIDCIENSRVKGVIP